MALERNSRLRSREEAYRRDNTNAPEGDSIKSDMMADTSGGFCDTPISAFFGIPVSTTTGSPRLRAKPASAACNRVRSTVGRPGASAHP